MNLVERAAQVWRSEGPVSFWFKLASELGYRRMLILERSLEEPIPAPSAKLPLSIVLLQDQGWETYVALRPETEPALLDARRRRGEFCFVASLDNRAVASAWVAIGRGWTSYLDATVELAPDEGYLFDAYTLPSLRGQGIAAQLCLHQLHWLRERGLRRAIRATLPENGPALRAHAKSGFRPVGVMGRVKLGPWCYYYRRAWVH